MTIKLLAYYAIILAYWTCAYTYCTWTTLTGRTKYSVGCSWALPGSYSYERHSGALDIIVKMCHIRIHNGNQTAKEKCHVYQSQSY